MSATNYGLSEKQQKVFKGIKERLNASIKEGIATVSYTHLTLPTKRIV